MFGEHGRVVDGIAQSLDLIGDVGLCFVAFFEGFVDAVFTEIGILDWTWVHVVINKSPGSLVGFQNLIRSICE